MSFASPPRPSARTGHVETDSKAHGNFTTASSGLAVSMRQDFLLTLKLQKETHAALFYTNKIQFSSLPNKEKILNRKKPQKMCHTHTHTAQKRWQETTHHPRAAECQAVASQVWTSCCLYTARAQTWNQRHTDTRVQTEIPTLHPVLYSQRQVTGRGNPFGLAKSKKKISRESVPRRTWCMRVFLPSREENNQLGRQQVKNGLEQHAAREQCCWPMAGLFWWTLSHQVNNNSDGGGGRGEQIKDSIHFVKPWDKDWGAGVANESRSHCHCLHLFWPQRVASARESTPVHPLGAHVVPTLLNRKIQWEFIKWGDLYHVPWERKLCLPI